MIERRSNYGLSFTLSRLLDWYNVELDDVFLALTGLFVYLKLACNLRSIYWTVWLWMKPISLYLSPKICLVYIASLLLVTQRRKDGVTSRKRYLITI